MNENDIKRIFYKVKENTRTDCIRIKPRKTDERLSLTASKFGGFPYWTDPETYPRGENGMLLTLLAQINLSDLPPNDMLPGKGLLQFFLLDGSWPGEWAVVFHEEFDETLRIPPSSRVRVFLDENESLAFKVYRDSESDYIPFMPNSFMPYEMEITGDDGRK